MCSHLAHFFHDAFQAEIRTDNLIPRQIKQLLPEEPVVVSQQFFEMQHLSMFKGVGHRHGKGLF